MRKLSFNFTDLQYGEFSEVAKRDGKTFAEVIRSALDEWLLARKRGSSIPVQINEQPSVTILLCDPRYGDSGTLYYDDATACEIDEEVTVWRNNKLIARFNRRLVDSWFME